MNADNANLVSCNVQVSPALARRIRKAAMAEQNGQDPRGALMIAADCKPDELTQLRTRVEELSFDLNVGERDHGQLKSKVQKLDGELSKSHKELRELRKAEEQIALLDETLSRSVDMEDLPSEVVAKFRAAADNILGGDEPKSAFLAAADYERLAVDEAISTVGSLRNTVKDLEANVAPLREVLGSGGMKAWIARRVLNLQ